MKKIRLPRKLKKQIKKEFSLGTTVRDIKKNLNLFIDYKPDRKIKLLFKLILIKKLNLYLKNFYGLATLVCRLKAIRNITHKINIKLNGIQTV